MPKKSNIIHVKDVLKRENIFDDTLSVGQVEGKEIDIINIQKIETNKYGTVYLFDTNLGTVRSFGEVLNKQLEQLKQYTDEGKIVRGKIIRMKNYYTFEF